MLQFRTTAADTLRRSSDPRVIGYAEYIWCRPYLALVPDSCLVVDNGSGVAVGYIIGTASTSDFVDSWRKTWFQQLEADGLKKPRPDEKIGWNEDLPNALRLICHSPEQMLKEEQPKLLADYPAHFHIDILPDYHRKGFGRKLIDAFFTKLRTKNVKGVHLIMAGDNVAAGKFYTAMGFDRFPQVLVEGASNEQGRTRDNSIWLVKSL